MKIVIHDDGEAPAVICPLCEAEYPIPHCIMWIIECKNCGIVIYDIDSCPN